MEIDIRDKLLNTLNSRYRLTDAEERLLDGLTNNLVEVVLYHTQVVLTSVRIRGIWCQILRL